MSSYLVECMGNCKVIAKSFKKCGKAGRNEDSYFTAIT
jgi:hypothetical protein